MKSSRDRQIPAKEVLMKLGNALIRIAKEMNTESAISCEQWISTIRKLQADFDLRSLPFEERRFFNEQIFQNKQSITTFVEECYNERIPSSWTYEKILERATQIAQASGLAKYHSCLERYLRSSSMQRQTEAVDVFSMELDDIKKEFENSEKYPTVASIRQALPSSLRGVLRDITDRDYAIRKLVDEMKQLRSVSKIQDIFSKGT